MKRITATIEQAPDGGFGIYTDDLKAVWGYGLTSRTTPKADFLEVLSIQAEEQGFELPNEIIYKKLQVYPYSLNTSATGTM